MDGTKKPTKRKFIKAQYILYNYECPCGYIKTCNSDKHRKQVNRLHNKVCEG